MTARTTLLRFLLTLIALSGAAIAGPSASVNEPGLDPAACARMKARGVLGGHAPVSCDKLAIVRFSHIDFEGRRHHDGEIMVMSAVAGFVEAIFETLYSRSFPIARAKLMDHYSGDDHAAMRDNNTSAFNHRAVTCGKLPSLHAYGLAIDVNPVQNPYIVLHADGRAVFSPAAGTRYANRSNRRPEKSARTGMSEEIVDLFAENGFLVWGGYWDAPVDYQHFQVERKIAEQMAALSHEQARVLFSGYVQRYRACLRNGGKEGKEALRTQCIEQNID